MFLIENNSNLCYLAQNIKEYEREASFVLPEDVRFSRSNKIFNSILFSKQLANNWHRKLPNSLKHCHTLA